MPEQQGLDSLNFDKNPFMDVIGDGLSAGREMPSQGGDEQSMMMQQSAGMPAQGGGAMGAQGEAVMPNQLERGQNPDKTKSLVSAIQQIENFIKDSTEKDEIQTARGIISLLVQLVQRDQETMTSQL